MDLQRRFDTGTGSAQRDNIAAAAAGDAVCPDHRDAEPCCMGAMTGGAGDGAIWVCTGAGVPPTEPENRWGFPAGEIHAIAYFFHTDGPRHKDSSF